MVAGSDHVFLVHVIRNKAMEQRKPRARTPKKQFASCRAGVFGVVDKLSPTIAVRRNRTHGSELNRCASPVQPLHKIVPGDVEAEILWLVNNPQAVLEADDASQTPHHFV